MAKPFSFSEIITLLYTLADHKKQTNKKRHLSVSGQALSELKMNCAVSKESSVPPLSPGNYKKKFLQAYLWIAKVSLCENNAPMLILTHLCKYGTAKTKPSS